AGVYNATGADLTLTASTITDTWAGTDGGGIYSYEADVVLTDSRIEHAHAGQFGGAIANDGPFNTTLGSLLVERSTLFGNFADYNSGAVYNRGRHITIRDSTLAHNNGGAIY